jgi:hypothetical protein
MKEKSGQKKKVLRELKEFISKQAGGDSVGLITAYLATKDGKEKCGDWIHQLPVFKALLMIILQCFDRSDSFHQRQWLSMLRHAGLKPKELHRLGCQFSKKAWCTAGAHTRTNYPGAPVEEKRGRPGVSLHTIESIREHALSEKMSRPSTNRTVKPKGIEEPLPVQYKNYSDREAYRIWKNIQTTNGRRWSHSCGFHFFT